MTLKEARAKITRQAILDAAEEAFYEKGLSGTTLEDIARRAGVTRGAIYWHFSDKTEVFQAIFERTSNIYRHSLEEMTKNSATIDEFADNAIALLRSIASDAQRKRALTIVLLRHEHLPSAAALIALKRHHHQYMLQLLTHFFSSTLAQPKDARKVAEAVSSYFIGIMLQFLLHGEVFDLQRHAEFYIRLLFQSIHAPQVTS